MYKYIYVCVLVYMYIYIKMGERDEDLNNYRVYIVINYKVY